MVRTKTIQVLAGMIVVATASAVHAQVPRPTLNIVGGYFYNANTGDLILTPQSTALSTLFVSNVQYLDGTTSTTDAIVSARFDITGLQFTGMDTLTGDALFTNGTIHAHNGVTTFFTADLINVRLAELGFGDFGNINIGFNNTNVTNLVFNTTSGSRFVDEFAALIAPPAVPDEAKVQFSLRLLLPFGPPPQTFQDNFLVSSIGTVLGVFDGAPTCFGLPTISSLDGDPLVVLTDTDVCFLADFIDPDVNDSHTATWDFGDGSAAEVVPNTTNPASACHMYAAGGTYTVTLTIMDECGNSDMQTLDVTVLNTATCFGINRLKIGTKQPRCKGISLLEVTSMVGTDQLVALYVPEEGKTKLGKETIVDDGFHGEITIHTSCSQSLDAGDVFGPYTVSDVVKIFDEEHDFRGNEVELRGSLKPGVPVDLFVDDIMATIGDGFGNTIEVFIPAGSFELDGHEEDRKKYESHTVTNDGVEVKAKFNFGRCDFRIKMKGVPNTNQFMGSTMTVRLQVGNTVGEETVTVVDKHNHLEHKKKPKLNCCPNCRGIAFLQITSDQGVLEFVPELGMEKLDKEIVVSDGVNPPVTIHTSCSQPIDVGDVFGDYTVSDLVKVIDD